MQQKCLDRSIRKMDRRSYNSISFLDMCSFRTIFNAIHFFFLLHIFNSFFLLMKLMIAFVEALTPIFSHFALVSRQKKKEIYMHSRKMPLTWENKRRNCDTAARPTRKRKSFTNITWIGNKKWINERTYELKKNRR